jgi:hypothetical protein
LKVIGFAWSSFELYWEAGFAALFRYKAREQNCRVPRHHIEGTFRLGSWVNNQRSQRRRMPTQRRQRLNEIGFVWRLRKGRH